MDEGKVRTRDENAKRRDQGRALGSFVACPSIANNAGTLCVGRPVNVAHSLRPPDWKSSKRVHLGMRNVEIVDQPLSE
jgi:hypothetical protein